MIRYQLTCSRNHQFEGWFRSSGAFDEQAGAGHLTCPICGDPHVRKALMAPALSRAVPGGTVLDKEARPSPPGPVGDVAATTEAVHGALREIRRAVEASCDNVGDRFAAEAIKRHDTARQGEEVAARGIYGTMSRQDRDRLDDEGIGYLALPWVHPSDA